MNLLYRCDKEGNNPTFIKSYDFDHLALSIFPYADNAKIYLNRANDYTDNRGTYLLDIVQRTEETTFLPFPRNYLAAVSDDGDKLAMVTEMSGKNAIWIYTLSTAKWYQTNVYPFRSRIKFNTNGSELRFFMRKNSHEYALYKMPV